MAAYRAAEAPALGALIADHRPKSVARIAVSILFLVVGAIIDLSAVLSPPQRFNHWAIVVIWGVVFPVFALLTLFGRKPDHLRVHEFALIVGERVIPWSELVELRTQRYLSGRRQNRPALDRHWLRTKDGQSIEARCGLVDLDALLDQLRARTLEALLPAARARLDAGETVTFGKLSLGPTTVSSADTTIPRSSAEGSFEGLAQRVTIRGKGSAIIDEPLEDVPNAHVLIALLRQPSE